jgi:hypothetical protein
MSHTKITPLLGKTSWWSRLIPLYIFIPTAVSLCVFTLHTLQYRNTDKLFEWSRSSRTVVQVIVHILSSFLALLWTYSICTLIGHWMRHRLSHESVNLNKLRLWSALTQSRADWNLPWKSVSATLGFLALNFIPATLWAGALTPNIAPKLVSELSLSGATLLSTPTYCH